MGDNRPIGVFDSGVGGLTVVKELMKLLPHEDIVYFGDTARVPYGTKSTNTIIRFSTENVLFLMRYNVKLIIIACNTSSSVALSILRRNFKVPIIGVIEPGAADALTQTKTHRIGVIGTATTVKSGSYEKEILKKAVLLHIRKKMQVYSASCPLFVPLVEEGWIDNDITRQVVRRYLGPVKKRSVDTLILGCTHYPLLKKTIGDFMGPRVKLVDSAISTAKEAERFLLHNDLISSRTKAYHRFFVSDEPKRFKNIGERFLGKKISSVEKVKDGV